MIILRYPIHEENKNHSSSAFVALQRIDAKSGSGANTKYRVIRKQMGTRRYIFLGSSFF